MKQETNLMSRLQDGLRSKTLRVGGYSSLAIALVLAIAIVINLMVGSLPTSITQIDMSSEDLLALSQQTKSLVSAADAQVTLYLLAEPGSEDDTILSLLHRYADLNSKISVVKKDPVAYPGFVSQYTNATLTGNDVLVVSGDRSRFISYNDIYYYEVDYSTYAYNVTFNGEGLLTSAIDYVTSGKLPKLYTLTGHGETTLSTSLGDAISYDNIQMASLNLLSADAIPEDASAILINGPTNDITADELALLQDYTKAGGNVMLVTNYNVDNLPNLYKLMADYAIEPAHGLLVEGSSSNHMRGYAYYLLPNISASHSITSPLAGGNYYVCTPLAHGLTVAKEYDTAAITVTKLLYTSGSAYLKSLDAIKESTEKADGDPTGLYSTAIASEKALDSGSSRVVWLSSLQAMSETADGWVSGTNSDFIINTLDWLCQKESSISIRGKNLQLDALTIPSGVANTWNTVLIFLVPGAFLISGIVVFVRRKRK